MGLSDYPSNSQKRLEGVAVGLFVRYRPTGVYPLIFAYLMLGNDLIFTDRIVLISSIKYAEIVE